MNAPAPNVPPSPAVRLRGVAKTYALYRHGIDRLVEVATGRKRHSEFVALQALSLDIAHGEVVGLVGMNGAGKSTLLKVLAGTLVPSAGDIEVHGRVSALLELGAGFHPEMTGRENVFLAGAVLGIPRARMEALYADIVDFAGLAEFMEQPVKTYSSGMFVRLAFAVATSVEPDVLIIDEALSVGDGAFARKSFDRIMGFKRAGKTILFCSHSLYQVEAICSRVIWIHHGKVMRDGDPADVIAAYNSFLLAQDHPERDAAAEAAPDAADAPAAVPKAPPGQARFIAVRASAPGQSGRCITLQSGRTDLVIEARFVSDPALPTPSLGFAIAGADGRIICSAGNLNDRVELRRAADGTCSARLCFPAMALLKGVYMVQAVLLSEDGIHLYDQATDVAELQVSQQGLEIGCVSLPHHWDLDA